ncbi:hypothetical protein KVA01_14300 [Kocuria varians]|uniref:Single-stranded DNA-binding protein n=1 Tax=Kocuria varians TaxID=1272 RepID=A0A4Y4D256_KOCVA|nr:single-stranded DNA-binding protein [Kocuria varians]GEC99275.1 hypothetical protein KVA01_14300 [Kocuria varians]
MSEQVTLRGFVGKDPESRLFEDGTTVAWFRLATTARRFDAATNSWHDGATNWYTVRCFRALAMHVMASVRCGQPVLVTGKLGINEWQSENGPRTEVRVDAASVGHDLAFGTANFSRAGGRSQRPGSQDGSQDATTETGGRAGRDGRGSSGQGGDLGGPGSDGERYRSAESLGLGGNSYVDVTSGAVLNLDRDDDTFAGLADEERSGAESENAEKETAEAGAH